MLLLVVLYLAAGLYTECAVFTLNPDWADAETWRHMLLWPRYLFPALRLDIGLPPLLAPFAHTDWRAVTLVCLLLLSLCGVWLARRLRARGLRRKQPSIVYS